MSNASHLTEAEVEAIIDRAIARAFERIGLDPADKKGNQADFSYLRQVRVGAEDVKKYARRAAITAFVTAALYALWWGFQVALKTKGAG